MKTPTIKLVCSTHGAQSFSAFQFAQIVLRCRCVYSSNGNGLVYQKRLPYSAMWWEQSPAERLKYSQCATYRCARKVVASYRQDFWCEVDLRRVKKLHEGGVI